MSTYEVHYCPPDYPDRCFPGRCKHEPQFKIQAGVSIIQAKGRKNQIEIDHQVCLACGSSLVSTFGGSVLVDLLMIARTEGAKHWKIGLRAQKLIGRWSRIATYLFDENGWNGRHRRIAKMIDPELTMRLVIEGRHGSTSIGRFSFDPKYLRPEPGEVAV